MFPNRSMANSVPLWSPREDFIARTAMYKFMHRAAYLYGFPADYDSLYKWSITAPEQFWEAVATFADIKFSRKWDSVLENPAAMPGARWFCGAKLNFAENLLRFRDAQPAIIFHSEGGDEITVSHREIYNEVLRVSEALREIGVGRGDRVAGIVANRPEAIIAMLATATIGAIWSSCSPDFGASGVLERFAQIKPRALFAIDGYKYNGNDFDIRAVVGEIANKLPRLKTIIAIQCLYKDRREFPATTARVIWFDQPTTTKTEIEFEQLPFDHPLYILYSSGTTGAPKCIIHSAGGTLIQHRKEQQLHLNLNRADRFFYLTTCGWMMWNWLASGLASGCALVLYEGAPLFPSAEKLWQLAERVGITIFGTSAPYISALAKANLKVCDGFDIKQLHTILSTGSPLAAENFDWVYKNIKTDLMLASISGGTDIVSCFVLGNPLRPIYRGEIQGAGLGMAVAVYKDAKAVRGARGELVCTKPFPNMPLGFWDDHDDIKFKDAYFSQIKGVWTQGDFAEITAHDGVIIYGRADTVLNPGGVRIGTAEIYRQVEKVDEVLESLCITQKWAGDERIVLFVVLRADIKLDAELESRIRTSIETNTTRRHRPKKIISVAELPRTRSGKIVELAVRNIIHGEAVINTAALANPAALDNFRNLKQLQTD